LDPLLRKVIDSPDDLHAREVYADALDEAGDPRGEFIHVQCELAKKDLDEESRATLEAKSAKLLKKHRTKWLAPFKPYAIRCELRCGFVESIVTDAPRFLAGVAFLADATPLLHVTMTGLSPRLVERLVEKPELARLRSLDLGLNRLGPDEAERIAACPHLGQVRRLALADNSLGSRGAEAIAAGSWAMLESLALDGNAIGDAGAAAIAASTTMPKLRALSLRGSSIGPAGARSIAGARLRLTKLDLRLNALGDEGAGIMARSKLPLVELDLSENGIGAAGGRALASAPGLRKLKELRLDGNEIDASVRGEISKRFA
jgi:uncharacterized protein (TIGR02996 family)